jgi:fumarate reductase subunit D
MWWSYVTAVVAPVLLVMIGLAFLVGRMLQERRRGQAPAGSAQGVLPALLILAAFAMGAFLTYALLSAR